jgi:hypothetical protein
MTTLVNSRTTTPTSAPPGAIEPPVALPPTDPSDPLSQVDEVLGDWSRQRRTFTQQQAEARAAGLQFEQDATAVTHAVIRPAFDSLAARLRVDGGDGQADERPSDDRHSYRLTFWMSLEGRIAEPRQDRNPYVQLDLDVPNRRFNVWEGDMWEKQGSSRNSTPWSLDEVTTEVVTHRVIAILRRAASHDVIV